MTFLGWRNIEVVTLSEEEILSCGRPLKCHVCAIIHFSNLTKVDNATRWS